MPRSVRAEGEYEGVDISRPRRGSVADAKLARIVALIGALVAYLHNCHHSGCPLQDSKRSIGPHERLRRALAARALLGKTLQELMRSFQEFGSNTETPFLRTAVGLRRVHGSARPAHPTHRRFLGHLEKVVL